MTTDAPRIGLGTDLHVMITGRPCILGGVLFECPVGPRGHSDGDAILHALTDALLGAGGLPDLGTLFPDRDPRFKDAPSTLFVEEARSLLAERDLRPLSADIVVECDEPWIGPQRDKIRANLGRLLDLPEDRVNVKGKTLEGTSTERETITVTAVVLVGRSEGSTV